VKAILLEAAARSGRSLTQEIELRLERSVDEEERGRTDTKFEQLRGDIKALDAKVSGLPTRWDLGLGLLALFVALVSVLALGTALFGLGFSADDISTKAAAKAIAATSGGRR
jgi:hypothetical protein